MDIENLLSVIVMNIETVLSAIAIIVAAIVAIIGWIFNGCLQRKHEIAKKRLDYRLEMLEAFIPIMTDIEKEKIDGDKLEKVQVKFSFFGYQDEIDLIDDFVKSAGEFAELAKSNQENVQLAKEKIRDLLETKDKLNPLVRNQIRKELGLPLLTSQKPD